ncbi:MAG: hypothetical protein ACTSWG_00595 [Candidatus Helarchaeota archaeon]
MKNKYLIGLILAITVISGMFFALPMPIVRADAPPATPEIGDTDRVNFLGTLLGSIFDNDTRANFSSNLIFGNTTAYFYLTHSDNYAFFEPSTYFYGMVYTGVTTSSDKKVYLESSLNISNLNIDFFQNISILTILWDDDKSFINFLSAVNNATAHNDTDAANNMMWNALLHIDTILTGDEMLIVVPVIYWKYDIDLTYNLTNNYIIDDDDDGPYNDPKYAYNDLPADVKTAISQKVQEDPSLAPLINSSGVQTINGSNANFFFLITEFWAKKIFWGFKIFPPSFTYDFDLVLAAHRLMGMALYNDSNNNDLMDVNFEWDSSKGHYYPVVDEAKFSLELVDAANCIFSAPIIDETAKTLKWNATLVNPTVRLNPWGVSSEEGVILNTTEIPVGDTSFGFTFKPKSSQVGNTKNINAILKLDHTIGQFNGSSGLQGKYANLDLAVLYATDVFELKSQSTFNRHTPAINSSMYTPQGPANSYTMTKTSSKTETLNFFVGTSKVAGLDLAGENYSINDGPPIYKANGAVIPYAMYASRYKETGELMDQQLGNVTADWSINTNFTRSIGAYIITYPDFNGSKIVHDPEFSMFGTITPSIRIPGFEWVYVLPGLALVSLVVILIRKRFIKIKI